MCGRFTLTLPTFEDVAELLGVEPNPELASRYRRRWNIAPSDAHWILVPQPEGKPNVIVAASWGFRDKKVPLLRAEAATSQPAFRLGHRCVIPADGFYEWGGEKDDRRPYWFHDRRDAPLLLAGLYRSNEEGATGFAILTTAANDTVRPVHDRMPVIVPRDAIDQWLRGDDAAKLLHPAPDALLEARAVSKRVNAVANDDAECLTPADGAAEPGQIKLFR